MSVRWKIGIILVLIGILGVANLGGVFLILRTQDTAGKEINLAGRQRMYSQKMVKYSLMIESNYYNSSMEYEDPEMVREDLSKVSSGFNQTFYALLDGDKEIGIPRSTGIVRKRLLEVETVWKNFYPAIRKVANPKTSGEEFRSSMAIIKNRNEELLTEMDQAVDAYQVAFEQRVNILKNFLIFVFLIDIATLFVAWLVVKRSVINPLSSLRDSAKKIASGDLSHEIDPPGYDDEVSETIGSVSEMRKDFKKNTDLIRESFRSLSNGDLENKVDTDKLDKDYVQIGEDINQSIEETRKSIERINRAVKQLSEGNLSVRVETTEMKGEFKEISESINESFEIINRSLGRILETLDHFSDKDFDVSIDTGGLKGDYKEMGVSVNQNIDLLRETSEREDLLHSLLRHDVRNKVQVIRGYLELMKDYDLPEDAEENLRKAERGLNNGLEIINKVRTLRKAQKETIGEVELDSVINKAIQDTKDMAEKGNVDIDLNCPEDGCQVKGGSLLNQVFSNIIENSIQHSNAEKIRIRRKETENRIICSIGDDGKGIPDDEEEKIFNKGYTTDEERGSGLGLFLVKTLLEIYNGQIEVKDSDLGGARFDIYLQKA